MSALFTIPTIPTQLHHLQEELDMGMFEQGFRALGFKKGSPGYRAIEKPVTPVDKAFQIYALHLAHSNGFGAESTNHDKMWEKRDAAWKAGADWLLQSQEVYTQLDKAQTRALAKILPEALRCQCSLELPPGSWDDFPKDGKRKSKEMEVAMDGLQKLGLNIKIHALAVLEGETPKPEWRRQEDLGTLQSMVQSVQEHKAQASQQVSCAQPSLF